VSRKLAESPDLTRRLYAERCACGAVLGEAGQVLAKEYDHIDIPPIRPLTTRIELFRATCPCCKTRVTASGLVAADPQVGPDGADQGLGLRQDQVGVDGRRLGGDAVWQVLALFGVEHGEAFEERDGARRLALLTGALALMVRDKAVGKDNRRATLAFAHVAAEREGELALDRIAVLDNGRPEDEHVDAW
jgi:hypothetical protein